MTPAKQPDTIGEFNEGVAGILQTLPTPTTVDDTAPYSVPDHASEPSVFESTGYSQPVRQRRPEPVGKEPTDDSTSVEVPQDWKLDEATKETGRRGIEQARAVLQAARAEHAKKRIR